MLYKIALKLLRNKKDGTLHPFSQSLIRIFCFILRLYPFRIPIPSLPTNVGALTFSNPVGLAAGFDKTGKYLPYLRLIGFGFVEVGTINFDASNQDENIISTQQDLKKALAHKQNILCGISLGSLRNDIGQSTLLDFITGMDTFYHYADFLVINLSRPNTQLRKTTSPDSHILNPFFASIKQHQHQLSKHYDKTIPIWAKLAVEYQHPHEIDGVLLSLQQNHWDAVILAFENWPDTAQVCKHIRYLKNKFQNMTFIVVGGILTTKDCQSLLDAGASLVQLYTTLVENGPLQTRDLLNQLSRSQ